MENIQNIVKEGWNYEFRLLRFKIFGANNLLDKDIISRSDPFVTVEVDGKEMFRTKVVENQLNPIWNEEGSFQINKDAKIEFIVRDEDHIGSDFLGKVSTPFQDLNGSQTFGITTLLEEAYGLTLGSYFELEGEKFYEGNAGQLIMLVQYFEDSKSALKEMFREFDRDGNGFIDINEAKNVVEKIFPDDVYNPFASYSSNDVSRFWESFNNEDWQNWNIKEGLINYEQFLIRYETWRMDGVIR